MFRYVKMPRDIGIVAMDGCVEPSRRSIVGAMPCARPGARWVPTFLFVLFIIPLPLPLAHYVIQRVALDRFAPGLFDKAYQFGELQAQRRKGALGVANTLFDNRAVQVVSSTGQGYLGQLRAKVDPVRLDVWKVVEHQTADGNGLQVFYACCLTPGAGTGQLGLIGQRDEAVEAACLVLQFAQQRHVFHPFLPCLNRAVEQGGVGTQPQAMSGTVDV